MFRRPPARALLTDGEEEARTLPGQFRARAARRPNDPRLAEVIGEPLPDDDAARWYQRRETTGFQRSVRRFRHPAADELRLRYVKLATVDEPGHHFLTYLPDDRPGRTHCAACGRASEPQTRPFRATEPGRDLGVPVAHRGTRGGVSFSGTYLPEDTTGPRAIRTSASRRQPREE